MKISKKSAITSIILILLCWGLWTGLQATRSIKAFFMYEKKQCDGIYLSDEEGRKVAYRMLSVPFIDHHDAFIELSFIGDERSVPHLISALWWEEPTGASGGMICTKAHCLEALRNIVNQRVGSNYPEWKKWWSENHKKARKVWISDGFRIEGLPVSDPPDEKYCSALIKMLTKKDSYLAKNAQYLLERFPPSLVASSVDQCMKSEVVEERLGLTLFLGKMKSSDSEERLRLLCSDPDQEVRKSALTELNNKISGEKVTTVKKDAELNEKIGAAVGTISPGVTDSQLLLGLTKQEGSNYIHYLAAFDIQNREIIWKSQCSGAVNCEPLISNGRIYYCCYDGKVCCIKSENGEFIWRSETETFESRVVINKLIKFEDKIIIAVKDYLWAIDCDNGDVRWKRKISPVARQIALSSGYICCLTEDKMLMALSVYGETKGEVDLKEQAFSLCSDDGRVYVVSGQRPSHLSAYSIPSMELLWQTEVGNSGHWPLVEPVIAGKYVLTCTDSQITSLDRLDGSKHWAVKDRADSYIHPIGDLFLIRGMGSHGLRYELRSLATGETVTLFSEPSSHGYPFIYVSEKMIVVNDMDGNLWILDMPKKPKKQSDKSDRDGIPSGEIPQKTP